MKLILLEDIREMKDIPQSIEQAKNLLENGEIAFRIAYEDVKNYLNAHMDMFSENDARDIKQSLDDLDSSIQMVDRKNINRDQGNAFSFAIQNSLDDLSSILTKYIILRDLYSKKSEFDKIKDKLSDTEKDNYEKIFDSISKAIKEEDPKLMTDDMIKFYRDTLEDLDLLSKSEQIGNRLDTYDIPFEKAKTKEERREIIRKFFSDEEFWGPEIGYYKLSRLGSPLITQLMYRGFNEKDNPFIPFLKEVLPNIDIDEQKYRIIHNAFVKGDITEKDLRDKDASKLARYLRNPKLYEQSLEHMEELIRESSGRNQGRKDTQRKDWHEGIGSIGINENNFKQCMAAILEDYADNESARTKLYQDYDLPQISNDDFKQWRWRLNTLNIDEDNYRDVLKYIYNRYNKKEEK